MENHIKKYFKKVSVNFLELQNQSKSIDSAIELIYESLKKGNKIIFCGNGGSASDSQHLAAELMGRYKIDRRPLAAISLAVDTSALTAIGNDYGYDYTFSRQLEGIGKSGDILISISTSGESKNVILAAEKAKTMNIFTIAFTGIKISSLEKVADLTINAQSDETNHIQEMHIAIGQLICGVIEDKFFNKK
tara:strand:+ start:454 stop:1026 length:573 start_codon:yes stop_codon:yes gene_type:complete